MQGMRVAAEPLSAPPYATECAMTLSGIEQGGLLSFGIQHVVECSALASTHLRERQAAEEKIKDLASVGGVKVVFVPPFGLNEEQKRELRKFSKEWNITNHTKGRWPFRLPIISTLLPRITLSVRSSHKCGQRGQQKTEEVCKQGGQPPQGSGGHHDGGGLHGG